LPPFQSLIKINFPNVDPDQNSNCDISITLSAVVWEPATRIDGRSGFFFAATATMKMKKMAGGQQ
jgi:hypothetical protein